MGGNVVIVFSLWDVIPAATQQRAMAIITTKPAAADIPAQSGNIMRNRFWRLCPSKGVI
ncbi:MAG: hypothetical protein ACR2P4_01160 [Gammaproteobacteria bacterium]